MNPILKNVLAVVAGVIVGWIINGGLIMLLGPMSVPEGVDPMDMESIKANMDKYQPVHFIVPFLAHALGTLAGAFTAAKLGFSKKVVAMVIGAFFLLGGIAAVKMIPGPTWFAVVDLALAYFPMAFLGHKLATSREG